ncbi:hypothetical protein [Collimonas sp.]|jgi:hypothetical protein|nr:hypothetical protein [Collimonas sp.]HWW05483.1 hypothetical protein [Collimonas sp.]
MLWNELPNELPLTAIQHEVWLAMLLALLFGRAVSEMLSKE